MRFPTHEVRRMKRNCAVHNSVPLFAVDNVGSITILMSSVKDKNNLLSSVRGMDGKNERSPELCYFLTVHASDITLRYTDHLKQDADNRGPKRKELSRVFFFSKRPKRQI
jgi:hypothetical protein